MIRHSSNGVQSMPKVAYHSGCHDANNWDHSHCSQSCQQPVHPAAAVSLHAVSSNVQQLHKSLLLAHTLSESLHQLSGIP